MGQLYFFKTNPKYIKVAFIICLACIFSRQNIFAQQIMVDKPLSLKGSLSEQENVKDLNGSPCAKITISTALKDASISGSYIVDDGVKALQSGYEVFVSVPKRQGQKITVKHNNYESLEIPLWFNDHALQGGGEYTISLKTTERTLYSEREIKVFTIEEVLNKASNIQNGSDINCFMNFCEGLGWEKKKERFLNFNHFPQEVKEIISIPNMGDLIIEKGMPGFKFCYSAETSISVSEPYAKYNCLIAILGDCTACYDVIAIHIQIPSSKKTSLLGVISDNVKAKIVGSTIHGELIRYVYSINYD